MGKVPGPVDAIVLGAGPAGLMAACAASTAGARVLVLERMEQPGLKLLATGGGRCNLTNTLDPERFAARFGAARRFVKPALATMPPRALRDWFLRMDVPTRADEEGRVFPTAESARVVLEALLRACRAGGVDVRCSVEVTGVQKTARGFSVRWRGGEGETRKLILATGGLGYPKLGGHASGLALARALGHRVCDPVPALVPLLTREPWTHRLPGIGLERVAVACRPETAEGPMLFTHRGLSGPAILDISGAVAESLRQAPSALLHIRWVQSLEEADWTRLFAEWRRDEGGRKVEALLARNLPAALARALCDEAGVAADTTAGRLRTESRRRLIEKLARCPIAIAGTEGFGQAMVTRGGVPAAETNMRTLESIVCPGLHLAGEALDVDGPSGGFNLQWAFSSGCLAGQSAGGRTLHG